MRTRIGRVAGLAGVVAALVVGTAACSKSVSGTALAVTSLQAPAATTTGAAPTGSTSPTSGSSGDLSQKAQQTCAQLPKTAVTQAFGVNNVTVTAGSGSTLAGGIIQVTCIIVAPGFGASVVVQAYPPTTITTAQQYQQILQAKYQVTPITVTGYDVAGTFQQPISGKVVDEAFGARKDTASNTVEVILSGVPDSPGVVPKLVTFLTALAKG